MDNYAQIGFFINFGYGAVLMFLTLLLGKEISESQESLIKNTHAFICSIFGMVFFIGLEIFKT